MRPRATLRSNFESDRVFANLMHCCIACEQDGLAGCVGHAVGCKLMQGLRTESLRLTGIYSISNSNASYLRRPHPHNPQQATQQVPRLHTFHKLHTHMNPNHMNCTHTHTHIHTHKHTHTHKLHKHPFQPTTYRSPPPPPHLQRPTQQVPPSASPQLPLPAPQGPPT